MSSLTNKNSTRFNWVLSNVAFSMAFLRNPVYLGPHTHQTSPGCLHDKLDVVSSGAVGAVRERG
jgi:hypothetical protein